MTVGKVFNLVEDCDDFLVVNKLCPLDFHDDQGVSGLFNLVKDWYLNQNDTRSSNLYPLHRLDKLTTGLLLMAKNKTAAATFGQMFERHQIQKFYLAISDGKPKKKQGWIKGDMAKARRGSYKLLRSMENPAITQFKSKALDQGKRLFLLKPHSGKTHQLRVALKSVGAPIVGDPLYQHADSNADRLYLHAWALQFTWQDKLYAFKADNPNGQYFDGSAFTEQLLNWDTPETQF